MPNNSPKVAIFYDWLNQWGGAEKVLLNLLELYPKAPVFTLVHDPSTTSWLPPHTKIVTSILNQFPFSKSNPIFYTPFYDLALEQFDFSQYDIVISTTSTIGHCLLTPPHTLFVCYFHNINRHLYERNYLKLYQTIDYIYSRRPDKILCNSQTVSSRLQSTYNLTPSIINPGIDTDFFVPGVSLKKYYLVVSRLVPHKKVDLVIKTFKKNKLPLIIIGTGRSSGALKTLADKSANIKFVGRVSNQQLLAYYQHCKALICPQLEDFGLVALEAQACGRPVIAYGRGGNTETIINHQTGLYFKHQTIKSLSRAILKFQKLRLVSTNCRQNALRFSDKIFMLNFKQSISLLWKQHQTTTY